MTNLATAANAGKFISRGRGRHICRTIDSWELIFVSAGTLDLFVGDDDFHLVPGQWILLPAGIRHGGKNDYPADLVFFWVHFYPDGDFHPGRAGFAADPARFAEFFLLFLSIQARTPQDRAALDLVLALLLHALDTGTAPLADDDIPPLARQCERMIQLHFREPISAGSIAAELGCSPDYLGRVFRRCFRATPTEFLVAVRMKHAAALLAASPLQISQIAADVGFSDPAYFRRCFRAAFAMTPGQYRALKAPAHINTD